MIRLWIASICLALLFTGATQAQSEDPNPCRKSNLGTSRGAGACSDARLREAERKLVLLENRYRSKGTAASGNREYTGKLFSEEEQSWRAYRNAKCAVQGDMEGGEDAWKNVWTLHCRLAETEMRSKALRKSLAKS